VHALGLADDSVVQAVLADWRTAPITPRMRAALEFLEKLTLVPQKVGRRDADIARAAGISDRALREVIYVCFLFSVMDRLADAFDFPPIDDKGLRRGVRIAMWYGYRGMSV
jgi:alkylhydroperoxidase family enzyme